MVPPWGHQYVGQQIESENGRRRDDGTTENADEQGHKPVRESGGLETQPGRRQFVFEIVGRKLNQLFVP